MAPEVSYSFSFITGGLFPREAAIFAGLLASGMSWEEAGAKVRNDNLLQARKSASAVRIAREIRHRLAALSSAELAFFQQATATEQRALLFIAVCRHYLFIREFVTEVLRLKVSSLDRQICLSDYTGFVKAKSSAHPELASLSDKSAAKIRQVLFRMLGEAGLIESTRNPKLTAPNLSRPFYRLIAQTDSRQLGWLLLSDSDIKAHA